MKKSLYLQTIVALAAISAPFLSINSAQAKATCSLTDIVFAGINATSCYNASANDTGNVDLTKSLSNSFGLGSSLNWSLEGKSDGGSSIGFTAQQNKTSGSLSFNDLFTSGHTEGLSTFVITLKASSSYAAYLFENVDLSKLSSTTGTFNTIGTSVNGRGNAQALSHASIFVANYTPYVVPPQAPEPPVENPLPNPITPDQPSTPPPSSTVVTPKDPVKKVPEPATTAALGLMVLGALRMKKKQNLAISPVCE